MNTAPQSTLLRDLNQRLGSILVRHVEPLFKDGTQLTIIARTPGNNEADVLVSSEHDLSEVVALVERCKLREVIKS